MFTRLVLALASVPFAALTIGRNSAANPATEIPS
jgi:hypothetical protein